MVQSPLSKVNIAFHLEIKVQSLEEERRGTESMLLEVQCEVSTVSVWAAMSSAGVGSLCFLKSTVNAAIHQDIIEHFMLPSADKLYGDADFIFQQDLALHTVPKVPKAGLMTMVLLLDWPVKSPDLNPMRIYGILSREDERHQTQQCR